MWTKKAILSLVSLIFIIFAIMVKATDVQAWKDLSTPSSPVKDNDTSMRGFDPRAIQMLHKNRPVAAPYSRADLGQQRAVEGRRDIKDFMSESLFYQQGFLTPQSPLEKEAFGCAVKIKGRYAIIGADSKNYNNIARSGSAYIYERVGTEWQLKSYLASNNPQQDGRFGWAVDIAGDYAVVGAPYEDGGKGAAYLYKKQNNSWVLTNRLQPNNLEDNDKFGYSVALNETYLLISAYAKTVDDLLIAGVVYCYILGSNGWIYEGTLMPEEPKEWASFGQSIDLEGNSVIIGAPFYSVGDDADTWGAVFIFIRNNEFWEQQAILFEERASWYAFGSSVALDGDHAVISATDYDFNLGVVYIYNKTNNIWEKQDEIFFSEESDNYNQYPVVDIDNNLLIVGLRKKDEWPDDPYEDSGAAYIYKFEGNSWNEFLSLKPLDISEFDFFGSAVSIDDSYLLVGSTQKDSQVKDSGAGYVFKIGPSEQCLNTQVEPLLGGSVRISWTRGNGNGCAVFVKEGNSGSAEPVDNTIYTANATFGLGSQIGNSGWYCVYNGTETSVEITGLNSRTSYRIHVCEYINGSVYYNTNTSNNNPITYETPIAVKLAAFRASNEGQRVRISWRTENEADLAGFALHAAESEKGPFRRISCDVIPANGGQTRGADYVYWDETPNAEKQWYRLELIHLDGVREWSQPIAVSASSVSADKLEFALHPNYPNPFNAQTLIRFDLPEAVETELAVYDACGRLVASLISGMVPAGSHEVVWDGRDAAGNSLASGVYYCRLKAAEQIMLQKMILVK